MSLLASTDTRTLWEVTLGIGVVVVLVVVILMVLLLSFIRDIERRAAELVSTAGEIAGNTGAIPQLATTASVLEEIKAEALVHHGYLVSQTETQ
jgi:membrane protein YdbS with pleckstrin-like domain